MAIASINPATGEVLQTFQALSETQIEHKLQLAVSAFRDQRKTSFAERGQRMMKAAQILEREKEACARLMTLEMGKPYKAALAEAVTGQPPGRDFEEESEKFLSAEVVGAGVTGREEAGIQVGMAAAKRIKKVVLELGGSDPFIVMPSADLDAAVATAVEARVINNGQSCIAAKRFIIAEPIAAEFERKFVTRMQALRIGDPFDEKTELGPLATADGVKSLDADVQKTVKAGAKVLTGGHPLKLPGNYYAPTVLTNIPKESPAYREEFFGPVASLFRVKDQDEAIRIANDSGFGLGATAWTYDEEERERFSNELEAGMVFINKMVASDPRIPFGGVKQSGHGRELGVHGIREFVDLKTVWVA